MFFTVYSKPDCPFCDQAKAMITQKGLEYKELVLDVGQTKLEGVIYVTKAQLLEATPTARTVPQVYVAYEHGTEYVGGFTELRKFFDRQQQLAA